LAARLIFSGVLSFYPAMDDPGYEVSRTLRSLQTDSSAIVLRPA
jgi:hypothetical protein